MVLRTVVVPLLSAYAVFLGVVLYAWRHPAPEMRHAAWRGDGRWTGLLRHVAATTAGGYVCFLTIVLVFHVWIAGQRGALASAVRGGGFLSLLAMSVFVLLSWATGRRAG